MSLRQYKGSLIRWRNSTPNHATRSKHRMSSDLSERSSDINSASNYSQVSLWVMFHMRERNLRRDLLVADVQVLQVNDASEVHSRKITTKKLLCHREQTMSSSHSPTVYVLKSDHPTEFGKTSQKEKNFAEGEEQRCEIQGERKKQILQFNNKNKTNWKQNMEAACIVTISKKHKMCATRKVVSHRNQVY